jgi:acyl-CoA dehydrogenase
MDFNLPEELQILRETVRRFVDKELIPLERLYRHDSEGPMPEHLLRPLQEKTKSMGLWMLDVPAEYGGAGLGLLPRCIIHEEIARAASLPFRSLELFGPEVRPVLFHCNNEQKERFLKPVLRGTLKFCFAQTEPDAGSDPANMRTRAVEDGDSYVINGTSASSPPPAAPTTRSLWPSPIPKRRRAAASPALPLISEVPAFSSNASGQR